MLIINHILNYKFAFSKHSFKEKDIQKSSVEISEKEKEEIERAKFERIENIIELMPIVFLLLGIIIMSILYKIFM